MTKINREIHTRFLVQDGIVISGCEVENMQAIYLFPYQSFDTLGF
jgi:hypothetical protein